MTLRRTALPLFLVVLCLFGLLPSSLGQTESATLSGLITDPQGKVVPGVGVEISNVDTNLTAHQTTNGAGVYVVAGLKPGRYRVSVTKDGFRKIDLVDLVLNVQDVLSRNFQLQLGPVSSSITVTADGANVNTTDATVSTVVDRQFVENMPLNGRSFQSLITLTPGIVLTPAATNGTQGQFSVNGQRSDSNSFIVDGVSANFGSGINAGPSTQASGSLPGLTSFGTTQSLASIDDLQEFRVQTSTYSAEYGRQPGGQISMVTRSGTSRFHGAVFDYFRNDALDANDWFANQAGQPKPPEKQNDFGGVIGGPIIKDKTFFFFSYEGLQLRQPQFQLTNVPTLALRQAAPTAMQPILNAFPLPNGADLGNGLADFSAAYSNPSSLNATSIRIDHSINQRWHVFGRYNRAPSDTKMRGYAGEALSVIVDDPQKLQTFTVGVTGTLTKNIVSELKANFSVSTGGVIASMDTFGRAVPVPRNVILPKAFDSSTSQSYLPLYFTGITSVAPPSIGVTGDAFISRQRQLNFVEGTSFGIGSHNFKVGVDYRRLTPTFAANSYALLPYFLSQQSVLNATADFAEIISQAASRPVYVNFSAYGEDTWKLSRHLTLTLGLRWDMNPAPGVRDQNYPLAVNTVSNLSAMQLAPTGTSLWKTTYVNFAPRFGAAYQIRERPGREMVVRGGLGVFYDMGNNQGSIGFSSYPFQTVGAVSNVTFPLSPVQVAPIPLPSLTNLTPPYGAVYVFDPNLKLPYTLDWNLSIEQALGTNQSLTISYVAAAGRRLLQQRQVNINNINPNFTTVNLTTNNATSDYNSLQMQFQRRLSRGLQALVSYTWSHALDDDSTDSGGILPVRGNADFDIRHVVAAGVTYDIPSPPYSRLTEVAFGRWSIDSNVHAQTAVPVDLIAGQIIDPASETLANVRPNVNPDVPFYISGRTLPGGKGINPAAFSVPPAGQFGNLGRNVVRGFGAWQDDLALRRQFKLTEKVNLLFRAEAFNLFNHPNFGGVQTLLTAANFGVATTMLSGQLGGMSPLYQIGGPRSMQVALKVQF
jgi:hypothetical protein